MENASKALIMAATSLIALMVLAAMVYLFRQGSRMSENYDINQIQRNLELYNSRFLNYNNNRNTISDIISVCNLAYDTNGDTDYDEGWHVKVTINIYNQEYIIPSLKSDIPKGSNYNRNKIIHEGEAISIYDLTAKTLGNDGLKLEPTHIIKDFPAENQANPNAINNLKLSEKVKYKVKDNIEDPATYEGYLFLFECGSNRGDGVVIDEKSGRVSEMNFNAIINPEIGKIIGLD